MATSTLTQLLNYEKEIPVYPSHKCVLGRSKILPYPCVKLSVQTVIRCPYSPVCNRIHQHLCTRLKSRTLAAILFVWTLLGIGSAALAAAVTYPGKATRISGKGQWSTQTKNEDHNSLVSRAIVTILRRCQSRVGYIGWNFAFSSWFRSTRLGNVTASSDGLIQFLIEKCNKNVSKKNQYQRTRKSRRSSEPSMN